MATPRYKDEVLVTFQSVDPPSSFTFPDRYIFLSKENPSMNIGRTSKRNAALEAAGNNAWFDSAVMSRDHARLTLDVNSYKVHICDIGSLHGTVHNGNRLSRQIPSQLNEGDTIKFGIPIERGADKYHPCVMSTHLKYGDLSPQDRPQVFRVPDESDVEDSCSEVEESIHNSAKIVHKMHRMIPAWTSRYGREAPARSQHVDLTMDEQYPISDVRDCQKRLTNSTDPSSSKIVEQVKETACVDLTGMSEDDADRRSSHDISQVTFGSASWFSDARPSSEAGFSAIGYSNSISSENEEENEDISGLANMINTDDSDDSQDSQDSEMEEDYAEGDFEEHDEFEDEDVSDSMGSALAFDTPNHTDEEHIQPPTRLYRQQTPPVPELNGTLGRSGPFAQLPSIRDTGNQLPEFAPKNWASLSSCKLPSLLEATCRAAKPDEPAPQISHLQSIVEKTGKRVYFESREENKIRVNEHPTQSTQVTPTTGAVHECNNMSSALTPPSSKSIRLDFEPHSLSSGGYYGDMAIDSMPAPPPVGSEPEPNESLLTPGSSKSSEPLKYAQPSAFDASSAYELEEMRVQAKKAENGQQLPMEQGLVVEEAGPEAASAKPQPTPKISSDQMQTNKTLKRKADDLSQLTREEEICEALSVNQDQPQTTRPPNLCFSNDRRLGSSITRPNKRLRRVVEAFGFAALGGVAVMSALIATAPAL